MKMDRLLGITIYLLNHGKTSARTFADKYEVSLRTIQRDMDTLCQAGIPISATFGTDGGYDIYPDFKLEHQLVDNKDYSFILAALKGLLSAYDSPYIENTYEKMIASLNRQEDSSLVLDFSVLKEDKSVNYKLRKLDECLLKKKCVVFDYTNAENVTGEYEVEPIAITYKWYNWYLAAYHKKARDYRLFKLVRMSNIQAADKEFMIKHEPVPVILKRMENQDKRNYLNIRLYCKNEIRCKVTEYLKGSITEEFSNGDFILELTVPENEHFWYASLLAFEDKAEVLEPETLKIKIYESCKKILSLYRNV